MKPFIVYTVSAPTNSDIYGGSGIDACSGSLAVISGGKTTIKQAMLYKASQHKNRAASFYDRWLEWGRFPKHWQRTIE